MRFGPLAFALVATLVVGACSLVDRRRADPIIDTWPVGEPLNCTDVRSSCEDLIQAGFIGLDERDPGHAAVVSARLHDEGVFVDPSTGKQLLLSRSGGCCHVLVVDLADGSRHAIGVGYPGISDKAVAIPWELAEPGR